MKKQFAIKSVQSSKNIALSAAKSESANVLNFIKLVECCPTWVGFSLSPVKTSFSL